MDNEKVELSYEALWKSIIRPPRDEYVEEQLGNLYDFIQAITFSFTKEKLTLEEIII
jgi:hypothetical protein